MNEKNPCLESDCSWCCDPVKIPANKSVDIPKNKNNEPIWKDTGEIWIPEDQEYVKLKTYTCDYYKKDKGICGNYEGRPDICKRTDCTGSEKAKQQKFIKVKKHEKE